MQIIDLLSIQFSIIAPLQLQIAISFDYLKMHFNSVGLIGENFSQGRCLLNLDYSLPRERFLKA